MKTIYKSALAFLWIMGWGSLYSQNCLHPEIEEQNRTLYPESEAIRNQLELETRQWQEQSRTKGATATKIIPVVFHILHQGGSENISMAQIRNQVDILNEEFQRLQADTILGPAAFRAVGGKLDVEFRLATKDPDGNCSQGVTRTYTPLSRCIDNPEDAKYVISWPRNKYLNVWLVRELRYSGMAACEGGGYAQFPGSGLAETDGVQIRSDLIGSIGTAITNTGWGNFKGRYLIHELGHWLNLIHIWGDQTCGNDLVSDTPPAQQSNSGCPTFPHNVNSSCNPGPNGEMFNNYMDYSQGSCLNMFTRQQAIRMEAALNSSAGGRNNLWSPANLLATGTETVFVPDCPAKPEIVPYFTRVLCGSGTIQFRDASWGGTKTSRLWSFPGGNPATSTDSIVTVSYATPGTFNVVLTNTNANGSSSKTFKDHVVVLPSGPSTQGLPAVFDFENNDPLAGWTVLSPNGGNTWSGFDEIGYSGLKSIRLMNSQNKPAQFHELISPPINLTNHSGIALRFNLHHRSKNVFNKDKMIISLSRDCGLSWTTVGTRIANKIPFPLNTITTFSSGNYVPFTEDEWREESINIPLNFATNNFRFKLSFTSGGGNNLYIDNVRITGNIINGTEDQVSQEEILVYPNPAQEEVRIKTDRGFLQEVTVLDVAGKIQKTVFIKDADGSFQLVTSDLAPGLYILECTISGRKVRKRLLING